MLFTNIYDEIRNVGDATRNVLLGRWLGLEKLKITYGVQRFQGTLSPPRK